MPEPRGKLFQLRRIAAYCWLMLVVNLTSLLPDVRPVCVFRGWLVRCCFRSCGKRLQLQSWIVMTHTTSIDVGHDVLISRGDYISGPDITIGDEVMLGPYVCVVAGNHTKLGDSYRWGSRDDRPIRIGRGSWLGANAVVTVGVTIGTGAAVAAGAVVTKDVPDHVVVAGVPARIIRSALADREDAAPLEPGLQGA